MGEIQLAGSSKSTQEMLLLLSWTGVGAVETEARAWSEVRNDSALWACLGCYGEDVPGVLFGEAAPTSQHSWNIDANSNGTRRK